MVERARAGVVTRGGHRALVGIIAAASLGAGCERGSSILLVEVAGEVTLQPVQLEASVSAGMRAKTFLVPPAPAGPIVLPASFSVELDADLTGPVGVYVAARDEFGGLIAEGETWQSHIIGGGQTIVAVMLVSAVPPVASGQGRR